MKKIKRNKFDNKGISPISTLIIIIIMGLLIWQYAIPLIDSSIGIPSDYLGITIPESELNAEWHLQNTDTGVLYTMPLAINEIVYISTDAFVVKIVSNVPYKLTSPYYIDIQIWQGATKLSHLTEPIPFSALTTDTFVYGLGLDLSASNTYQVEVKILNGEQVNTNLIGGSVFLLK